ncbi:hypothetical protein MN116_000069, partial [Schistosoma mekongi]
QVGLFEVMNLLLIFLYLLVLNEKLAECFKIKYLSSGTKSDKRNIGHGIEFIVGDKFRIQVVMSEEIRLYTLFHKFKKMLIEAVEFWTKIMHPKIQSKQQILMERDCDSRIQSTTSPRSHYCQRFCKAAKMCNGFQIPKKYLKDCRLSENDMYKIEITKPADADFVLFVGLNLTRCPNTALAEAGICQQDPDTDRPVSGTISICSAMNYLKDNPNKVKQVIIHELAHCFGFMYSMLPYLRDEDGHPRTRRNPQTYQPELEKHVNEGLEAEQNTIKYVWRAWQTASNFKYNKRIGLTLPSVLSFARKHFGCNNLDAVDLEVDGGQGTELTHFERRLSISEIMSGSHDIMASVSGLTLNFFKDTGWYNVNVAMAESWKWGHNQGCQFIRESCGRFIERQKREGKQTSTWCENVLGKTSYVRCIPHTNAYGYCNLIKHNYYLNPEHTHFNNLANISTLDQHMMGGMDRLADHCPYMSTVGRIHQTSMNSHCGDTDNRKFKHMVYGQQHYGKKSHCFNFKTRFSGTRTYTSDAGCFRFNCTLRFGLQVYFYGNWYTCPREGGTILIPIDEYSEDLLECPSFYDVCSFEEMRKRKLERQNKRLKNSNNITTNRILLSPDNSTL